MSGNTTNLGKSAQTGTLVADTVRTSSFTADTLTATTLNATTINATGVITGNVLSSTTVMSSSTISTGAITSTSIATGSATVTNTITAQSFSQPDQKLGTAASPSALTSQAYSIAFTRYIFYFAVANNTQFNQTFTLTSFPDGFFATQSAFYDATFVATGPWTAGGSPITTADLYADESTNTLNVNVITPVGTPPVFTGTCYIKVVISLSVD